MVKKTLRILIVLLAVSLSSFVAAQTSQSRAGAIRAALEYQRQNYPASQLRDVYKNFMQDYFGPGHLLNDTAAAARYLDYELTNFSDFGGPDYEPTGFEGNFYRVNLRLIKDGTVPYEAFFPAFVESVTAIAPVEPEVWMSVWNEILKQIEEIGWSFENEAQDRAELAAGFEQGNFIAHHSKAFNLANNFHYRIISREVFEKKILPFLQAR